MSVESVEIYEIIAKMGPDALQKEEAMISMKYKTVEKKVKPAAIYQFLLEGVFCR